MIATLSKSQAELPRLVELASQGEGVVITVDGKPKARLTRADGPVSTGSQTPVDMAAWLAELEEVRRQYSTGNAGLSAEQILDEDRSERV